MSGRHTLLLPFLALALAGVARATPPVEPPAPNENPPVPAEDTPPAEDPAPVEKEWDHRVAVTAEIEGLPGGPLGTVSTVLDPDRIAANDSNATAIAVGVPGVSMNGQGGHFQTFSIRGVSQHRVMHLVAGMRIFTERRAGASISFIDPHLMESIDVLRGPATTFYGSGALGGAMLVSPRQFEGWNVRAGYDTRGNENYQVVGWGEGGWSAGVARRDAANASAPDGAELNTHFTQYSGLLRYRHEGERRDVEVLWIPSLAEDVGKSNSDFPERTTDYPRERHQMLRVATEARAGWRAHAWVHAQGLETTVLNEPASELSRVANESFDWGLRWERDQPAPTGASITWGFEGVGRSNVNTTETFIATDDPAGASTEVRSLDDASQFEAGAFATATWNGSRVDFEAGARLGGQTGSNGRGLSVEDEALNGFVGWNWHVAGPWELRANLSSGQRFPTLSELYFTGTTGRGSVIGNPDLEAERALSGEAAIRYTGRRLLVSLGGFRTDVEHYIEREEIPPGSDVFTWVNRTSGTIDGVELQGMLLPSPRVIVDFGGQWMRGRDDDGDPLSDVPPNRLYVGAGHRAGRVTIDGRWTHRFALDDPESGEQPLDGADLLNLSVAWNLSETAAVALVVDNLLDEKYVPAADDKAALAPRRSIGLQVRWNSTP